MLKFWIYARVYVRETLYQWRAARHDRRRQIEHEAHMAFYDRDK